MICAHCTNYMTEESKLENIRAVFIVGLLLSILARFSLQTYSKSLLNFFGNEVEEL